MHEIDNFEQLSTLLARSDEAANMQYYNLPLQVKNEQIFSNPFRNHEMKV